MIKCPFYWHVRFPIYLPKEAWSPASQQALFFHLENNPTDISSAVQATGVKLRGPVTTGRAVVKLMLMGAIPVGSAFLFQKPPYKNISHCHVC